MLTAIDLCCGGGGWACAARGLPIAVTHAFDFWETALATYALNHPGTRVHNRDLSDVIVCEMLYGALSQEPPDVILGGIPCEWLSSYRSSGLGNAPRPEEIERERRLLDNVLDLCRRLTPRYWCLEDVIALRKELPILTPYTILDARHWSPQRRKRIYVGVFPKPKRPGNTETLASRLRPGPYRIGKRSVGRTPVFSGSFNGARILAAIPDRKAPTVITKSSQRDGDVAVIDAALPGGMRQFEWQELAALQGFPDDYLFVGSPTDTAKMVGRAVQIDLARAILQAICRDAGHSQLSTLNSQRTHELEETS